MLIINKISLLDFILRVYGSPIYAVHFIEINPQFSNILDIIPSNTEVKIDNFRIPITNTPQIIKNVELTTIGVNNQSMFDIMIRNYGTLNGIVSFLTDNPSISNIGDKVVGKSINITNKNTLNTNVLFYDKSNSILTTDINLTRSFNRSWNLSYN